MKPERIALYVQHLGDLSERQIHYAFTQSMNENMYIPKIAEIRVFAQQGAEIFQREDAVRRTKQITDRAPKPDDWNPRLDSIWEEIERRADVQELQDLAYFEPFSDSEVERIMREGKRYPGKDRFVDWVRRREARERRAAGAPRPNARKTYGPIMQAVTDSPREPGAGAQEDL